MWSNLAPRRPTAVATCPARVVVPRAETGQDPAPPTKPKKFAKKRKAESFEALAALEGLSSESLADIESLSVDELKKQKAKEEAKLRKLRELKDAEKGIVLDSEGMATWKQGSLLPEGFNDMELGQKLKELWMGKYGALYWSTRLSYVFIGVIVVGYIVFRFVGPLLGFYELYD